jgi:hypothetical protein
VAAVVHIQGAVLRILPARDPVAVRIQVVLLISLDRIPAVAVVRMSLARGRVAARIPAAVLRMSLARVRVLARIQEQRHTLRPAAVRIPLLLVTAPVMVRVMRLRRKGRRMRHKLTNPPARWVMPMPPQTTVSTQTLRTAISTQMSEVEMLQIV